MKQLFKGLRLGMLLQLAVGPVCLYIFQTASAKGLPDALAGVMGVALADGVYILAAILGIATLIEKKGVKKGLNNFGALILLIFGVNIILGVFRLGFIPSIDTGTLPTGSFVYALLLTLSNPLTILFWAGLFSSRIARENMKKKDIYQFGLGALTSTIIFLSAVAAVGNFAGIWLPALAISILNVGVGAALIIFGIRMLFKSFSKKENTREAKTEDSVNEAE